MECIYRYTFGSILIFRYIRVGSCIPARDTSGTEGLRDCLPDEFVYAYFAFESQSPSEVANIIHLALETLIDRPR